MDTPLGLDDPASGYTKQGHALHNEQVCDYLAMHGGFSDWVVTTTFYSAIHWIEDYLFPCVVKDGEEEIEIHSLLQKGHKDRHESAAMLGSNQRVLPAAGHKRINANASVMENSQMRLRFNPDAAALPNPLLATPPPPPAEPQSR
ncbi:MAG: hypothetical protein K1X90_04245 [Candidatus Kapabacteria bacterium]|nr:hypothetical protein [Candidatus Kapabacteria bacterium]